MRTVFMLIGLMAAVYFTTIWFIRPLVRKALRNIIWIWAGRKGLDQFAEVAMWDIFAAMSFKEHREFRKAMRWIHANDALHEPYIWPDWVKEGVKPLIPKEEN